LTMIGVLDRLNKPDPASVVSRDTTASLLTDMRRDDTDPKRITDLSPVYDAFQDGKLSRADFGFLKQEFTDMRTPEGERLGQMRGDFLRAVAPMVDKSIPMAGFRCIEWSKTSPRRSPNTAKAGSRPTTCSTPPNRTSWEPLRHWRPIRSLSTNPCVMCRPGCGRGPGVERVFQQRQPASRANHQTIISSGSGAKLWAP